MFDRFRTLSPSAGRLLRTLVIALLAAVAGCDRTPRWRGVGTDAGEGRPAPNPEAAPGSHGHGAAR